LLNSEVSSSKELTFNAYRLTPINEADKDNKDNEGDKGDEDDEDDKDNDSNNSNDSDKVDEGDDSNNGDDGNKDDKDYKSYKGEKFKDCKECKYKECKECEECEECKECEGCEKYKDYKVAEYNLNANLQGFIEQNKHYKYYIEAQPLKSACETNKIELELQPHYLTSFVSLKNSLGCNNKSIQDPAFNISS
jgi:hypothetical protein